MDEKTRDLFMQDVIKSYIKYEREVLRLKRVAVISCTVSIILLAGMFFQIMG